MSAPVHVVVMGVSATGKTTVGEALAVDLGYEFIEGDDYHPRANVEKMSKGVALTDEDRMPWLQALSALMARRHALGTSTVLTCSALRRSYRDVLRASVPAGEVFFVHLHAPFDVLEKRMTQRTKHFMPTSLLVSQFQTLEPLEDDEAGVLVDVSASPAVVVRTTVEAVRARHG